jgi:cytochrome c
MRLSMRVVSQFGPQAFRSQLSMSSYRRLFLVAAAVVAPALCAAGPKPDIENGKATFTAMCGMCHSVVKTGGPTQGPNLLGVVGRKAASEPEFALYTPALKASGITWSTKTLDKFLMNPMAKVPGTAMPMLIPDNKTRADVVAYLATLKK